MKIGLAQINPTVGDLSGNAAKILQAYREAVIEGAELVITPELALTGYPPLDLLFKSRFVPLALDALAAMEKEIGEVPLVVGTVDFNEGAGQPFRNTAVVLQRGQPMRKVYKSLLPTYDVFDEDRYFEPATTTEPVELCGRRVGITICEDIWTEDFLPRRLYAVSPVESLVQQGAELILNLSASPFSLGKPAQRLAMLAKIAEAQSVPIVYCNAVGGNDQLIFDGNSLVLNAGGQCVAQLAPFREEIAVVTIEDDVKVFPAEHQTEPEELFDALTLGLRDYVQKCGFRSVGLGLSGGIDSAITAALAAAALGPENVLGVALPSRFSSQHSLDDAAAVARNLGIRYEVLPIQPAFEALQETLRGVFAGKEEDVTEENIQPRVRATLLMALSNKFGHLLLTTGNKSELAVGYCTIYGDMAGGLAVISDVPKTKIYELSRWINREREIIPANTIEKPPSAELRPNQTDQDTLPPYEVLDEILKLYVEEMMTARDIIAKCGLDEKTVRWVARRVDLNEWKREQAAPGLRVTSRAFGLGRRMPIAQGFVD
ncbi:MAG: NAD+ synthase [Chthoniobacteraceae bacterium]